jgi:hypothetical protein
VIEQTSGKDVRPGVPLTQSSLERLFCFGLQTSMDCRGKHGSATMLYFGLGILVILLSYVFVKAVHHTDPNAQPHAPLHDTK